MKQVLDKDALPYLAVMLIDMQDCFIESKREKERLIPYQIEVLKFCKDHNVPVIVAEYYDKGPTTDKLQKALACLPQANVKTIIKHNDNAFEGTDLAFILKDLGTQYLLVMGINACACVLKTAKNAVNNGLKIITSKTLIAGVCDSCSTTTTHSWYEQNGVYPKNHEIIFEPLH